MKKFFPLLVLASILFISCRDHNRDVSITYHDADEHYSMHASFSKKKIRDVERYMDRMLGDVTNMSFVNSRINGEIALDDNTVFYIKKSPGNLKIRLNKYQNSEAGFERIRELCEGIEDVIVDKEVVVRVE